MRDYLHLFLFVFTLNVLFSGGRLASSDELSMFLTTESIVERGDLAISPELVGNGSYGRDGKFYSGAGIAQPVLSIPFYVIGKIVAHAAPFSDSMKELLIRGIVSLFNQLYAGLIAIVMLAFGIKLGLPRRIAFLLTLCLLLCTNLFPYLKSYMREPQLLFYLLCAAYLLFSFKTSRRTSLLAYAGILCGLGFLTRVSFVITLPILFLYLFLVLKGTSDEQKPVSFWISILAFALPIVAAFTINFWYNYAQFGDVFATGYSGRGGFTTPLFVGLYGLLFSSGKSFFLYAPICLLTFSAMKEFHKTHRAEAYLFSGLFLVHLFFFAKWFAWAGDGSWGPRFLLPTLPFMILPLGALLLKGPNIRRVALFLAALGFAIQIGGVSIYLGNYHREIGEYPYTTKYGEPEFLYKSHFIPDYSPVVGHWKMLIRNAGIALSGEKLPLTTGDTKQRIPLTEETRSNLLLTLDFWFMYAWYAGIWPAILIASCIILFALTCLFGYKAQRAFSTTTSSFA